MVESVHSKNDISMPGQHSVGDRASTSMVQGIFISGRPHSGNTMLCRILSNHTQCFSDCDENLWFEWRPIIEKEKDIQQRVHLSIHHLLPRRKEDAKEIESQLLQWYLANPDATVYDLFNQGMHLVTLRKEKKFWALKATSYIFYADEILKNLPNVKMIYLVRNPMDLMASDYNRMIFHMKHGEDYGDWLYTPVIGWAKGLGLAVALQKLYPVRFCIVKYEELCSEPQKARELFEFVGVKYEEGLLNVPHANRSELPHRDSAGPMGLNTSRIYYYTGVLSPSQIHAGWSIAPKDMLRQLYPDLPEVPRVSFAERCMAQWHKFVCAVILIRRHAREFVRQPGYGIRRLWKRARILVSRPDIKG